MADHVGTTVAALVASRGNARRLRAGEVLFREGETSDFVYECTRGSVRLVIAAAGGRELLLDVAMPGDVFGELSAIDGEPRSATAVAMEPAEVVEMQAAAFRQALRSDSSLAMATLNGLCRQLRRADERIWHGETEHVRPRLARLLLDLADRFIGDGPADRPGTIPLGQHMLGEWIGATRESTARALGELRRAGIIDTGRSMITVLDRAALERAVQEVG